ncbi:LamG domain-containing protein [Saccharomonospora azurea]|uniref:LamG domain-containing protein n=1 Tax=Saccharomonospora azurea TaxID=40988 RepID=UPI00240A7595|nr:LamG domain-containing protein [Saccharomonospora azurea]
MSRRAESAGFVLPACVVVALSALFLASFPLVSHAGLAGEAEAIDADSNWRLDGNARSSSDAGHHGSLGEYPSWGHDRSSEHNSGEPLREDDILLHADCTPTLVHEMRLDETGGTTTADSVGGRTGTLHNGAQFGAGRIGNAIHLDGMNDHVSTAEADLRFDRSFTVAAWVRINERSGKTTAVSVDGAHTSKFRLGHVRDNQNRLGTWYFEMAESDSESATITKAASSPLESEVNTWVHLVGVYDADTGELWLYINGTRHGDGTLQNAWDADGGLQIGRGKSEGTPAEFWPGAVDDVRLYTGALTADHIETLFRSYRDSENPSVP